MKLEIGDYVRIEPLSDEEKHNYRFECDGGQYMWSSSNLKRIRKSDIMLF